MTHANAVDWSDPRLKSLLDKVEGWALDNRGIHTAKPVKIHIGMGASGYKKAELVFRQGKVAIITASFQISAGECVQIDDNSSGAMRTYYGVVAEERPGQRVEDHESGVHVHWVHINR